MANLFFSKPKCPRLCDSQLIMASKYCLCSSTFRGCKRDPTRICCWAPSPAAWQACCRYRSRWLLLMGQTDRELDARLSRRPCSSRLKKLEWAWAGVAYSPQCHQQMARLTTPTVAGLLGLCEIFLPNCLQKLAQFNIPAGFTFGL